MNRIERLSINSQIAILATVLILLLLPVTIFSVISVRPSLPTAAVCYDFTGDGRVNEADIDLVLAHFGAEQGDPDYDPRYDLNGDGIIFGEDINILASHEGETCPPTASFSASRTTINRGQSTTLTWSTTRASSVSISSIGSVARSGSKVVSPSSTKTYKLTATGPGGSVSKSITIRVNVPSTTTPPSVPPTPFVPTPSDPNSVTFLRLTTDQLTELAGQLKLSVSIGGTKFKKGVTITKNTKKIDLKISEGLVKKNKTYTITIKGGSVLTTKVKFKATSHKKTIKVGKLYLGDINLDNKVAASDLDKMLADIGSQEADVNLDGVVNSLDYSIIIKNLGKKGD